MWHERSNSPLQRTRCRSLPLAPESQSQLFSRVKQRAAERQQRWAVGGIIISSNNEEPIVWFAGEDAGMLEAIRRAQESFPQFVAELEVESRRIIPAMQECLIKYAFPATSESGVAVEHMFLGEVRHNGTEIRGVLASEPMYTTGVAEGDEIVVEPNRVSDWLYLIGGKAYGGFTFVHMWNNFSEEERRFYRDQPPFAWLDLP